MTVKHKHKKAHPLRHAPKGQLRVLRNPVTQQKAANAYHNSIEMQEKFLAAQRAINNRIMHDRQVAAGMAPAILLPAWAWRWAPRTG